MLVHPADDVARHVISGMSAPVHLQAEVRDWRRHYGIFAPGGGTADG